MPKTESLEKEILSKQAWADFSSQTNKILEIAKDFRDKFDRELKKEKNKKIENNAYSGLACLVGGFLMQAIGVIVQLIL